MTVTLHQDDVIICYDNSNFNDHDANTTNTFTDTGANVGIYCIEPHHHDTSIDLYLNMIHVRKNAVNITFHP